MSILKIENLSYTYENERKSVFENLNFEFERGKIYAIVGKSGAGKTTLLSLLSGLTPPTKGKILLEDKNIENIDKYKLRSQYIGVIFQNFNLLTHLTAEENVILSMDIANKKIMNKKEKALELLKKVEIEEYEAKRRILKLSGGQQQRVAIARTLSYDPQIILADEPTGNLDNETQEEIMKIFRLLANEGKCVIIVTHSPIVAKVADYLYELISSKSQLSEIKSS